jgi:hypothetical protein
LTCPRAAGALAPPADTTWSPVEFDQEVRFNVIRKQMRRRRPGTEKKLNRARMVGVSIVFYRSSEVASTLTGFLNLKSTIANVCSLLLLN